MENAQQKILNMLDEITAPLTAHIEKLENLCNDGKRHTVAQDFLLMYKAEKSKYIELRMSILEEFLFLQQKAKTPTVENLSINTPVGDITAQVIPDKEYPGIGLFFNSPGQPGVIMEYDPIKDHIQIRIYGKEDPEGDPVSIMRLSD